MKTKNIIVICLLAVACALFITSYGSSSSYVVFKKAQSEPEEEFHVVGKLNKEKGLQYDPAKNANYFSFYLLDDSNQECRVVYHNPKPQDFERGEKIVVVGRMQGDSLFEASQILLKCPSKYNDQKPQ